MSRLASSLVVVGALGFMASFATAVGCAGSGSTDEALPDVSTNVAADGGTSSGSKIGAPKGDGGDTDPKGDDTGDDDDDYLPLDGGPKKEAGVDAGPPLPPPVDVGSPCPTQDQILTVACGTCGTKTTVCEKKEDGSLGWSAYGPCGGEHGVCVAGTTRSDGCNNCGTRTDTCTAQCTWATGTCTAAGGTGCVPGSYDIVNAGCDGADLGLYRVRQCSATCGYDTSYSTCQSAPTAVEVGPTVGSISSTLVTLGGNLALLSTGTCPVSSSYTWGPGTAYAYTQVHNPLSKPVQVYIYHSVKQGGTPFDTSITAYAGDQAPTTVDARKQCLKSSLAGNTTYTGDSKFASLDTTKAVTIPANGWVTVYSTAKKAGVVDTVKFSVRTAVIDPAP